MKCVVLAAGYATRLYPLTENFPKPLLPVGEKPILNWLLDDIDQFSEVTGHIVVSNHKFIGQLREWAEKQSYTKQLIVVDDGSVCNEHRLGAVKDIQYAVRELSPEEDVMVIAGDNLLDFSLKGFVEYAAEVGTSVVMCHEEMELAKQQKTAIITLDEKNRITSYEEKPKTPKGNLAVPPFYIYKAQDIKRIGEALEDGCGYDAPGSFAAWLSGRTAMHAWLMPGRRYDIGDMESYNAARELFRRKPEVREAL